MSTVLSFGLGRLRLRPEFLTRMWRELSGANSRERETFDTTLLYRLKDGASPIEGFVMEGYNDHGLGVVAVDFESETVFVAPLFDGDGNLHDEPDEENGLWLDASDLEEQP